MSQPPARSFWRAHAGLWLALAIGLALRVALWGNLPRTGWISDEGEYFSAASWLAAGRGFGWYLGYLWTRAPLYPLFLAVHLRLFGETPTPIYLTQTALSLLNVALVYALAGRVRGHRRVPAIAATLAALYFPFAVYTQALLSETLFISLLLAGFLLLAWWPPGAPHDWRWLVLAGGVFGLATLARSLMLTFLPLVALWLFVQPTTDNRRPTTDERRFPWSVVSGRWSVVVTKSGFQLRSTSLVLVTCQGFSGTMMPQRTSRPVQVQPSYFAAVCALLNAWPSLAAPAVTLRQCPRASVATSITASTVRACFKEPVSAYRASACSINSAALARQYPWRFPWNRAISL